MQCDDGSHILRDDEQKAFLAALSKALLFWNIELEEITMMMICEEKWDDLKAIQGSVDVVGACLSQKHAGVPGCWSKRAAVQTIERVCNAFGKQPLMKRTVAHLQQWGGNCGMI